MILDNAKEEVIGFLNLCADSDFGRTRGSSGVGPFKLPRGHFLESASKWHDEQYKAVDWLKGTWEIDQEFCKRALALAQTQEETEEAYAAYSLCRNWGQLRQILFSLGVSW